MPQGNVGYLRHIKQGEKLLDEEDSRDRYYNMTDQEIDNGVSFRKRCQKFDARAERHGYPTLAEIRVLNEDIYD
jgi:hypothetical protein